MVRASYQPQGYARAMRWISEVRSIPMPYHHFLGLAIHHSKSLNELVSALSNRPDIPLLEVLDSYYTKLRHNFDPPTWATVDYWKSRKEEK